MKSQRSIASVLGALALAVTMGGTAVAAEGPTEVEAQAPFTFGASAWGSTVKVADPVFNSGKSAYVGLGCTAKDNIFKRNNTLGVDIPGLADIGAVTSEVSTERSQMGEVYTSTGRSTVESASLLEGEVELGAIETTATTSNGPDGYSADVEFSIASLTVAGVDIELTGEEQFLAFPGLEITIAKEKTNTLPRQAKAKGTAVKIKVLDSGAVIKIGEARASIDGRNVNAFFSGGAYGTTVEIAGTITSGKTANRPMPCQGTGGEDLTNTVASADLGGLGTADAILSTVNAAQGPLPQAHARNEISEVNLTGGLVRIEGITASVSAAEDADGNVTFDTSGTEVTAITVAGISIEVPPPGGEVLLPGVGTLSFFEQTSLRGGRGLEVIAVRITLFDGTEIVLSRAAVVIK